MSTQHMVLATTLIASGLALAPLVVAECPPTAGQARSADEGSRDESAGDPCLVPGGESIATLLADSNRGHVEAMNRLGIMYARGTGVGRNYEMARIWFLRSSVLGYSPAMVNLGTIYQLGASRHRNYRRAYAWLRVALVFGVPTEDHDSTVYKLGMLAAQIGPANTARAERLAGDIAEQLAVRWGIDTDRFAESP